MKKRDQSAICILVIAIALSLLLGCAAPAGSGDVALLAQDLRDVAQAGTVYALAENPAWRDNITLVRDQLRVAAAQTDKPLTFDALLSTLQGLPIKEMKSSEALLAITTARITLRRAGRNAELSHIRTVSPLASGLADGITDGLSIVSTQ